MLGFSNNPSSDNTGMSVTNSAADLQSAVASLISSGATVTSVIDTFVSALFKNAAAASQGALEQAEILSTLADEIIKQAAT